MKTVKVDFSKITGPVRPLHGVNQGPMTKVFTYDARAEFAEAAIPFCRLHDTEYPYGSGEFVDIPCIFRNFDADENDPANYNFGLTDEYIARIRDTGAEAFFRLGVSIEHAPVKRYIYPPKDFAKWARVCEHIIRHYNEGWADGHEWNIRYWEIWNESDGRGNMWLGTAEEFYEFYTVAARHLKSCFPALKIGGCGWTTAKNGFIEGFMKYISSQNEPVPLDFFSWHRYYSEIGKMLSSWKDSVELLEKYGYPDAENIFDEWNYMEDWNNQPHSYVVLKNYRGGAFCAATLAALQSLTDVAVATYFEGDVVKEWCGLFDVAEMSIGNHNRKATMKKLPPFYAFKHFGDLYRLGNAVLSSTDGDGIFACAATGNGSVGLLCANYGTGEAASVRFELDAAGGVPSVLMTSRELTDAPVSIDAAFESSGKTVFTLEMPEDSFVFIS